MLVLNFMAATTRPDSYGTFYGLKESPFSLTPDPRFLFESPQHSAILESVLHGLQTEKGVVSIIGGVGTGKTTLCYALLEMLSSEFRTAFVINPHLSPVGLLRAIAEDLGIPTSKMTQFVLMRAIERFLLDIGAQGKSAVVIVDEAQRLSLPLLEQIRILSNFQTPSRKLLQMVLAGQTELEEKLQRHNLRQLNQRIGVRCYLNPLSYSDTVAYIDHRFRRGGLSGTVPLSRRALKTIWTYSKGTPRLVNLVCDRALVLGYAAKSRRIGNSLADRAVESLHGKGPPRPSALTVRPSIAVAGLLVALFGGSVLFQQWNNGMASGRFLPFEPSPVERPAPVEHADVTPGSGAKAPTEDDSNLVAEVKPVTDTTPGPQEGSGPDGKILVRELLGLWKAKKLDGDDAAVWPTTPDGRLDFELIAALFGLEANRLIDPLWSEIKAIGLPAIVEWYGGNRPHLLVRFEGDGAWLASPEGQRIKLDIKGVQARRLRGAWIYWRNADGWTPLPAKEWSGRMVRIFAYRLSQLGYLARPFPETYDGRFADAVRGFQRRTGLSVDGILGPRTAMTLARMGSSAPAPVLGQRQLE